MSAGILPILQVQFLDADHLLLSLGAADALAARNSESTQQVTFLVVYDLKGARVVSFHDNRSPGLLHLYLNFARAFHAGCLHTPWERFITPCPAALHAATSAQRSQHWAQPQVSAPPWGSPPPCASSRL